MYTYLKLTLFKPFFFGELLSLSSFPVIRGFFFLPLLPWHGVGGGVKLHYTAYKGHKRLLCRKVWEGKKSDLFPSADNKKVSVLLIFRRKSRPRCGTSRYARHETFHSLDCFLYFKITHLGLKSQPLDVDGCMIPQMKAFLNPESNLPSFWRFDNLYWLKKPFESFSY